MLKIIDLIMKLQGLNQDQIRLLYKCSVQQINDGRSDHTALPFIVERFDLKVKGRRYRPVLLSLLVTIGMKNSG